MVNKGLIILMARMAMWWFLLIARNIAAPPSLNYLGEIGLLNLVSLSVVMVWLIKDVPDSLIADTTVSASVE